MFQRMLITAALAVGAATSLHAQGWIDIERRPGSPANPSVFRISST